jgi:hypothetical protein
VTSVGVDSDIITAGYVEESTNAIISPPITAPSMADDRYPIAVFRMATPPLV